MAITGIGNSCSNVYEGAYAAQKNEAETKAEAKDTASARTGNMKQAGTDGISDYYVYLQKNYDCMSKGNITISGEYLKECSDNSAKAKELEDFLKKIPELEKQGYEQLSAQNKALGGTVTYYQQTWMIHKDGSIQSTVYSVTETDMTNAERMKKNMEERLEKQKEKKEEEEKVKDKKEKEEEEKVKDEKNKKVQQAEKLNGNTEKISVLKAAEPAISVKYMEAESELEAKAMMQKERLEDAYYPKFDVNI